MGQELKANAGKDKLVKAGGIIRLDGRESTGDIVYCRWYNAVSNFTFGHDLFTPVSPKDLSTGTHRVALEVRDRQHNTSTDELFITVYNTPSVPLEQMSVCSDGVISTGCLDKKYELKATDITDGEIRTVNYSGKNRLEWNGKGVFDTFIDAYTKNINTQFDAGRIVGAEYTKAYSALLTTAMSQAIDMEHKNQDLGLKSAELCMRKELECQKLSMELERLKLEKEKMKAQIEMEKSKLALEREKLQAEVSMVKFKIENIIAHTKVYDRQRLGFDDNLAIQDARIKIENYSRIFASGLLDDLTLPTELQINSLGTTLSELHNRINQFENASSSTTPYKIESRITSRSQLSL